MPASLTLLSRDFRGPGGSCHCTPLCAQGQGQLHFNIAPLPAHLEDRWVPSGWDIIMFQDGPSHTPFRGGGGLGFRRRHSRGLT